MKVVHRVKIGTEHYSLDRAFETEKEAKAYIKAISDIKQYSVPLYCDYQVVKAFFQK